jgi:hypothetical protein
LPDIRAFLLLLAPSANDVTGDGAADGVASVAGVGASRAAGIGSADGAASVSGVGTTDRRSIGTADGTASVSGVGATGRGSVGTATGAATVLGIAGSNRAIGTATGAASVLGIPSSSAIAIGTADGSASVIGNGSGYALISLAEVDCIEPARGQPVLKFSRVDPSQLPREVEVQYIDPTQNYAMVAQGARHHQARIKNGIVEVHASTTATMKSSIAIDFEIGAAEARTMAFDMLYRAWTEAVSVEFVHPDLRLESGDVFTMAGRFGSLVGRIDEQTWTKQRTNSIKATLLAPVGPAMGSDDAAPEPSNAIKMRTNIGIGIWGDLGAWGQPIPTPSDGSCCSPVTPADSLALIPGVHIVLKRKTSSPAAVEFLAGAS